MKPSKRQRCEIERLTLRAGGTWVNESRWPLPWNSCASRFTKAGHVMRKLRFVFLTAAFVRHRPLSPSSVAFAYRSSGETPCWHCPASTPSAKHAGSSTAPCWSKMALESVSSWSVCAHAWLCHLVTRFKNAALIRSAGLSAPGFLNNMATQGGS